jgi:alkylmercury lyase
MTGKNREDVAETIEHIAARWAEPDRRILRQIFPLLAVGQPVPVDRIAQVTGSDFPAVERALLLGRTGRDAEGRVTELFGVMLAPTVHRVEVDEAALFCCCALTAHLVPMLTQETATVESVDPVSRRLVRLTITPSGLRSVEPEDAVGTLVRTDREGVLGDVGANFCSHVHHFASSESAAEFVARVPGRYALAMDEYHEAARGLYGAIWS